MSADDILATIANAHAVVMQAEREFARTERAFERGLITVGTLLAEKRQLEQYREDRDRWLDAAAAHAKEWCHDYTECAICQEDMR